MTNQLYPLGTVLYLQDGTEKVMVVGRVVIYQDEETNSDVFVDYMGIIFEGLKDDEEERFLQVYEEWLKKVTVPKKEIK